MNTFETYLRLGYEHILDFNGLDHIIFIIALTAVYQPKHWLRMLLAVSFFTLGHSLTLTLVALDLFEVNKRWVEFLIPLTIVLTSLFNLTRAGQNQNSRSKYWVAGLFGMIHGFGFGSYYGMLTLGEINYWQALLPFNLGVELGQIAVVLVILLLLFIFQIIINIRQQLWITFLSGGAFALALIMCIENWPLRNSLF